MKPPALARLLVRFSNDREDADFVIRDLDLRFQDLAKSRSTRAARRWYWSQVVRGLAWRARPDVVLITIAPGRRRTTASVTARAPTSPPDRTKSPSETSSVASCSATLWSTSL